jgi:hypothetical protein
MNPNAVTLTDSASAVDFDIPKPGVEGYEEWRKTGKLPEKSASEPEKDEKPPKQEAPEEIEPSEDVEESAPSKPPVRADSGSAKPQGKKKTGDERFQELANSNRELRELNQKLLERIEQRLSQTEVRDVKAAPQAAEKKAKPKLTDNDPKTGKPFQSIEAWSDAVDQWNDERVAALLEDKVGKAKQEWQQTSTERILAEETQRRSAPAMKKYPDFLEVVTNPKLLIPEGSTAKMFLLHPNTKNVGEVSYYLGKHPELLESFYDFDAKTGKFTNKVDPIEQTRILMEIEREVSEEPAPAKIPARVITQAPRPPHQISGKSPAPDALAKAVEDGDQAEYTRLTNERILASRKSARR